MWLTAVLLKPFLLFLFFALLVVPLKVAFVRYWPEGRIKRLLLRRVN